MTRIPDNQASASSVCKTRATLCKVILNQRSRLWAAEYINAKWTYKSENGDIMSPATDTTSRDKIVCVAKPLKTRCNLAVAKQRQQSCIIFRGGRRFCDRSSDCCRICASGCEFSQPTFQPQQSPELVSSIATAILVSVI